MREIEKTQKIFICHRYMMIIKQSDNIYYFKKYTKFDDALEYVKSFSPDADVEEILILKGGNGWGHIKVYERKFKKVRKMI
ncbi:MAG: hypothetical protein RBR97_07150 [Bacteroidales bacterium]|nr:hypothetical protein [Bacteroidales bacterium]